MAALDFDRFYFKRFGGDLSLEFCQKSFRNPCAQKQKPKIPLGEPDVLLEPSPWTQKQPVATKFSVSQGQGFSNELQFCDFTSYAFGCDSNRCDFELLRFWASKNPERTSFI